MAQVGTASVGKITSGHLPSTAIKENVLFAKKSKRMQEASFTTAMNQLILLHIIFLFLKCTPGSIVCFFLQIYHQQHQHSLESAIDV